MAQINTTIQNDEISRLIESETSLSTITTCWLGALGWYLPPENPQLIWSWYDFPTIEWNEPLYEELFSPTPFPVDQTISQGLYTQNRQRDQNPWRWSHSDNTFASGNGRRCVACLDLSTNDTGYCMIHNK